MLFGLGLIWG